MDISELVDSPGRSKKKGKGNLYRLCSAVLHTGTSFLSGHYTAALIDEPLSSFSSTSSRVKAARVSSIPAPCTETSADEERRHETGSSLTSDSPGQGMSQQWVLVDDNQAYWMPQGDVDRVLGSSSGKLNRTSSGSDSPYMLFYSRIIS